jgi:hypothetical protein
MGRGVWESTRVEMMGIPIGCTTLGKNKGNHFLTNLKIKN